MFEALQTAVRQGNWREARRLVEEALQQDPSQVELYRQLATICESLGDWASAEQALRQYLLAHPEHVEGHYWLGRLLEKQGRWREAEETYRRVLEMEPEHRSAKDSLEHLEAQQPTDLVEHRLKKAMEPHLTGMPEFVSPGEAEASARRAPAWLRSGWLWRGAIIVGILGIVATAFLPQRPRRAPEPSELAQTPQSRSVSNPFRSGAAPEVPAPSPPSAGQGPQNQPSGLQPSSGPQPSLGWAPAGAPASAPQPNPPRPDPNQLRRPEREPEGPSLLSDWLMRAGSALARENPGNPPSGAAPSAAMPSVPSPAPQPGPAGPGEGGARPAPHETPSPSLGPTAPFPGGSGQQPTGTARRPTGSGGPGTGWAPCPTCGGQGATPDPNCGGTGLQPCPGPAGYTTVMIAVRCENGIVHCLLHFGEGCTLCDDLNGKVCPVCRGRGAIPCPVCQGTGIIHCPQCKGMGRVPLQ